MTAEEENVVDGVEDRGKRRQKIGYDFVGDSVVAFSFLGIQMLQFGFQLWECNVIFIVQYVSSQVVQHLTVSVDVCVYCLFPVVVVVCCVSVVCKCLS